MKLSSEVFPFEDISRETEVLSFRPEQLGGVGDIT